eukprot:1154782-Pelagomonas_calceolata.AAC.4
MPSSRMHRDPGEAASTRHLGCHTQCLYGPCGFSHAGQEVPGLLQGSSRGSLHRSELHLPQAPNRASIASRGNRPEMFQQNAAWLENGRVSMLRLLLVHRAADAECWQAALTSRTSGLSSILY